MQRSRHSDGGSLGVSQAQTMVQNRVKVIVDKKEQNKNDQFHEQNIYQSVTDAVNSVEDGQPSTIKITSNLYDEKIVITKPGMEIRPKEKGGEVTIQQKTDPCFIIDIGKDNVCTLYNLRMLLKGPNRDNEPQSFMTDMGFENQGNEECMKEFFTHNFRTQFQTGA